MNMADELEGAAPRARSLDGAAKPAKTKTEAPRPKRKTEKPIITDDLTGKFLRVGNKIYRTSDDKTPILRLESDRIKTRNIDALPDIIRIAKANGWTSVKINGGDKFKKAAFLAAAAQGLTVENYKPSKLLQAEAERLQGRIAQREKRRESKKPNTQKSETKKEISELQTLSKRFLKQTSSENARDPELRPAQSLVAQAISIASAKYPDDPLKASKEIEAKRQQVATRIAKGDKIAIIQVRNRQAHRIQEITQNQALQRDGRSR